MMCAGETIDRCPPNEYWERDSETCVQIPSNARGIDQTGYACNLPYWKNEGAGEGEKCVLCTCPGGIAKSDGNCLKHDEVDCASCYTREEGVWEG